MNELVAIFVCFVVTVLALAILVRAFPILNALEEFLTANAEKARAETTKLAGPFFGGAPYGGRVGAKPEDSSFPKV